MPPAEITKRFRVSDGRKFRLADIDPSDTCGIDIEKSEGKALLAKGAKRLAELQERLYAEHNGRSSSSSRASTRRARTA